MNKPFKKLDKKMVEVLSAEDKMILHCPEYAKNPKVGKILFRVTKGHPCGCCNRPKDCKIKIK